MPDAPCEKLGAMARAPARGYQSGRPSIQTACPTRWSARPRHRQVGAGVADPGQDKQDACLAGDHVVPWGDPPGRLGDPRDHAGQLGSGLPGPRVAAGLPPQVQRRGRAAQARVQAEVRELGGPVRRPGRRAGQPPRGRNRRSRQCRTAAPRRERRELPPCRGRGHRSAASQAPWSAASSGRRRRVGRPRHPAQRPHGRAGCLARRYLPSILVPLVHPIHRGTGTAAPARPAPGVTRARAGQAPPA